MSCYAVAAWQSNVLLLQVKSTWDENLYTTRLDPTKIGISRDEADRMAREIEGSVAGNRHLAEERNQSRDTGEEVSIAAHLRVLPTGLCFCGCTSVRLLLLFPDFQEVGVYGVDVRLGQKFPVRTADE